MKIEVIIFKPLAYLENSNNIFSLDFYWGRIVTLWAFSLSCEKCTNVFTDVGIVVCERPDIQLLNLTKFFLNASEIGKKRFQKWILVLDLYNQKVSWWIIVNALKGNNIPVAKDLVCNITKNFGKVIKLLSKKPSLINLPDKFHIFPSFLRHIPVLPNVDSDRSRYHWALY